jgi:hypothetical protein
MGRKKTFPDSNAVNPLQRMLGTYLRLERTRLGRSSLEIATKLGLTDTYWRLAESGRATLNQSLAFTIIEIFADSNAPTHDTRSISFPRLALFMVGMHWLGAEMARLKDTDRGERAAEALALRVSDFQVFLDHTQNYFKMDEGSAQEKVFLEQVAAPEVGDFLRLETYGRAAQPTVDAQAAIMQDFLSLPTLNFEILSNIKQDLKDRPLVHTADIAAQWEARRAPQFRNVRGLFRKSDLIVREENLLDFHFPYLSEGRFLQVQMIFMDVDDHQKRKATSESADAVKKDFKRLLNEGRKRAQPNLEPLKREEIEKIHFRCLSDGERKKHEKTLNRLLSRASTDRRNPSLLDAYWSFETHSDLQIGFVGVVGGNTDNTRNLNLSESLERAQDFRVLWDQLNANSDR